MRFFKKRNKICIFTYHKTGYWFLYKVFSQISEAMDWKFQRLLGMQKDLPNDSDVVLFAHSLIDLSHVSKPYLGIHVIRDPRDIIVSGYLYHRRTKEKWCINADFDLEPPIMFPQVPYSQQHRPEKWKRGYLLSLNGKSYQENLLSMSQHDGLLFEMNNYGTWTIESIRNWDYTNKNILELKFENIISSFDHSFCMMFDHLGFSKSETYKSMKIARKHDLKRKSFEEIQKMNHVSSEKIVKKWEDYFEEEHKKAFLDKFGNLLVDLGYETTANW